MYDENHYNIVISFQLIKKKKGEGKRINMTMTCILIDHLPYATST